MSTAIIVFILVTDAIFVAIHLAQRRRLKRALEGQRTWRKVALRNASDPILPFYRQFLRHEKHRHENHRNN